MTKAELLTAMAGAFDLVDAPALSGTFAGANVYTVEAVEYVSETVARTRRFRFYVVDEGGAGEAARFDGRDPTEATGTLFATQVKAAADDFVAGGPNRAVVFEHIDNEAQFAIAKVYTNSSGNALETRKIARINGGGSLATVDIV